MKILFSIFTAVLIIAIAGSSLAYALSNYSSSLDGRQSTQRVEGKVNLTAQSSGDLPGTFNVNVNYNSDGSISGGDWELIVTQNSDGNEVGTLKGTISGGTATFDADDWVSSGNFQLNVTRGTGSYSSVTSGTGNIQGTVDREDSTPFSGTLTISF